MREYLTALRYVLDNGVRKPNRTGVDTLAVFGYQMRFDLDGGFPILTTKKVHFKSVMFELLWMLRGDTNIKFLTDNGVTIWNEWADENGELGPVYGKQWRRWAIWLSSIGIDQIDNAIETIKSHPDSRRIIVTAWNPAEIDRMKLPPCHCFFQFLVVDGRLNLHLFMRSADIFLGVPFNIASYALLLSMVSQVCGLRPGELVVSYTDLHLYVNHIDQSKEQLSRDPYRYDLPQLILSPEIRDIDDFKPEHIGLLGYESYPAIKATVAV